MAKVVTMDGNNLKEDNVSGITVYSVTTADCENTASEIDVISFTVPANTWKEGETIEVIMTAETLHNSGTNRTLQYKAIVQGITVIDNGSTTISSNASEGRSFRKIIFRRVGSYLYSLSYHGTTAVELPYHASTITTKNVPDINNAGGLASVFNTIDYDLSIIIKLTLKWSAAHANTYYRILDAIAYKLNS